MENVIENGAVTEMEYADVGDQQEMAQEGVVSLSEILSEARRRRCPAESRARDYAAAEGLLPQSGGV